MSKKYLLWILVLVLLVNMVSALTLGSDGSGQGVVITTPTIPTNVSAQNTNSSDYWDNLDTPADIGLISSFLSWIGNSLNFSSSLLNSTIVTLIGDNPTGNNSAELTIWLNLNRTGGNVLFTGLITQGSGTVDIANSNTFFNNIVIDNADPTIQLRDGTTDWEISSDSGLLFDYETTQKFKIGTDGTIAPAGNVAMVDGQYIGFASSNPKITFDDTNNYIEITDAKVGIGTATPNAMLSILGADGGYNAIRITEEGNTNWDFTTTSVGGLTIDNSASDILSLNPSGGNIGIGTTNPSEELHIYGVTDTRVRIQSTDGTKYPGIEIAHGDQQWDIYTAGGSDRFQIYDATGGKTPFQIEPGAGNNVIRIQADSDIAFNVTTLFVDAGESRVGINTVVPVQELDVRAGDGSPVVNIRGSTNPMLFVRDDTNAVLTVVQSLDTTGWVGTQSNHRFDIRTNNAVRILITDAGLVDVLNDLKVRGSIYSGTLTISVSANDTDVSGINTLWIDSTSNAVRMSGFVGGVDGQVLNVVRLDATNVDVELEHNKNQNQEIYLNGNADSIITNDFGGWTLVSNGVRWREVHR